MEHPKPKDKNIAIQWARTILSNPDRYLILDSETTGLGKKDIIIQLGILNLDNQVIYNSFIRPTSRKTISMEATAVHGLTMETLKDAHTFKEVYPEIKNLIREKEFVIYNAKFDTRMLTQTAVLEGIKDDFKVIAQCAMLAYSMFVGDWSDYHSNYKYQKLKGGDHSAIGDCKATLDVIKKMASTEPIDIPRKWWEIWK